MLIGIIIVIGMLIIASLASYKEECFCEGCKECLSGWMTEEYANKYPECKFNKRNNVG